MDSYELDERKNWKVKNQSFTIKSPINQSLKYKDNLFELPPLFKLIQESSKTPWREMYQVFNMGHRMEIYLPARFADTVMAIAEKYGIEARVIGRVKKAQGEKVTVKSPFGKFEYA